MHTLTVSSRLLPTLTVLSLTFLPGAPLQGQQSHLVIISGISGGPEYAERFRGWSTQLIDAAEHRLSIPAANIVYLSEDPPKGVPYATAASTKPEIERTLGDLAGKAAADDVVLVVLIGHGSTQGSEARFNIPGPDLTARDYARLLDRFPSQRVALVNAASASGEFVAALSKNNRAIVTATRSGGEKNETVFGGYFAQAFASDGADTDKDGKVSLLEAFEFARREVARFYESEHRLQTEHALIDDNGDGQGSREPDLASGDGALAKRFVLIGGSAGRRVASSDSILAPLYADVRKLEEQVATLRAKKDTMKPDVYDDQLEKLLVRLAETNQEIRQREKKP
ncbi:MAG: hypothetical protein HY700_01265 [Gemmatimonadetes bacterium]|nr:hypothetical protein [Gemmatimonadota bacterium]